MDVAARWATSEDATDIASLHEAAMEDAREKRGGALLLALPVSGPEPGEIELAAVGTINDAIVGYLRLVTATLTDGRRLGQLTDLFVLPDGRGVGVGEALMALTMERAEALDLDGLESVALPGDRGTKNFFETHGLVARAISVHRSLRP